MFRLGWIGYFGLMKLLGWFVLSLIGAFLFVLIIMIRITVPRFKVESLARMGWATGLMLLLILIGIYGLGLVIALKCWLKGTY